jgi:hypothetical protein
MGKMHPDFVAFMERKERDGPFQHFYRIETPNGLGICQTTGSVVCDEYCRASRDRFDAECEHCRWYGADGKIDEPLELAVAILTCEAGWSYAFPTLKALVEWFPDPHGREAMAKMGAQVWEYKTAWRTMDNGYELLFDKDKAHKVKVVPWKEVK